MKLVAGIAGLIYIAASAAIIAAAVEIRSIVFTGITAAVIGILLALVAAFCRWRMLTAASLSLPILALILVLLINLNHWGPSDAQRPVTVMLLAYEALTAPLWIGGLWRTIHASPATAQSWQVSLRSLMALTMLVAVTLGLTRVALHVGQAWHVALAIGMFLAVLLALSWLALQAAMVVSPNRWSPARSRS